MQPLVVVYQQEALIYINCNLVHTSKSSLVEQCSSVCLAEVR